MCANASRAQSSLYVLVIAQHDQSVFTQGPDTPKRQTAVGHRQAAAERLLAGSLQPIPRSQSLSAAYPLIQHVESELRPLVREKKSDWLLIDISFSYT